MVNHYKLQSSDLFLGDKRLLKIDSIIKKCSRIHNDLNYAETYSNPLDESNDLNDYAQLSVFARHKSGNIIKDLMNLITLKEILKTNYVWNFLTII